MCYTVYEICCLMIYEQNEIHHVLYLSPVCEKMFFQVYSSYRFSVCWQHYVIIVSLLSQLVCCLLASSALAHIHHGKL